MTIREFMRRNYRHFNAAVCVEAAEEWIRLLDGGGRMLLTMAGAMSTGELGISLAEMIRKDKVHALCVTGANLEEDVFNLVAHSHYKRIPHYRHLSPAEETALAKRGLNRVTDTCIPEDEAIRRHYDLPQRYVLYLAGHDVRKNVAGLIEAFATVVQGDADVSLVVGGRLPVESRPPLYDPRPLARELGIAQDVRFVGWVEETHKPALYRGAACAVFASRYEGFGLPVLEALACGTPLITTTASSLPELTGDAAMAVDPDDTAALAGAILACLVDETLASELRQRGPLQAAQFRWADTARQTLAAYQQAAKRAGG